eukprot:gene5052-5293_t
MVSNIRSLQWQMAEAVQGNKQRLQKNQSNSTSGSNGAEASLPSLDWAAETGVKRSEDMQSQDQLHPVSLGNAGLTAVPGRGGVASAVQQGLSFVADIFRGSLGVTPGGGHDWDKGAGGDITLPSAQLELFGDNEQDNPTERPLIILPFLDWNNAVFSRNSRKSNVTSDSGLATHGLNMRQSPATKNISEGTQHLYGTATGSKSLELQPLSTATSLAQQQQPADTLATVIAVPGVPGQSNSLQPRLTLDDAEVPLLYTNSMSAIANSGSAVQPIQFIPTPGLPMSLMSAEPGPSEPMPIREAAAVVQAAAGVGQHLEDDEVALIPTAANGATNALVMETPTITPAMLSKPVPNMKETGSGSSAKTRYSSVTVDSNSSIMEDNSLADALPAVPSMTGSRIAEHTRPLLTAADARAQRAGAQTNDAKPSAQMPAKNSTAGNDEPHRLSGWVIGAIAAGCFVGVISLFGIALLARAIKLRRQQLAEYDLHSYYMHHENSADQLTDPAEQPGYYYYDEQGVLQYAQYPHPQDEYYQR